MCFEFKWTIAGNWMHAQVPNKYFSASYHPILSSYPQPTNIYLVTIIISAMNRQPEDNKLLSNSNYLINFYNFLVKFKVF